MATQLQELRTRVRTVQRTRFTSVTDRLAERCALQENGCWLWMGSTDSCGYGQMSVGGRLRGVHRVAYEVLVEPIPDHLEVDHVCRATACFNPDHLELVTHLENVRRGLQPQLAGAYLRERTHCPQGHPYDEANTYHKVTKSGRRKRECRACAASRERRKRAARTEMQ